MAMVRWAIHLTLESSTKENIKELAEADRRSMSTYLSTLVEQEIAQRMERRREQSTR